MNEDPIMEKVIRDLGVKYAFYHGDKKLVVVCLIRSNDRWPLNAPWWRGKQVSIVGADINGNFFFRHSDGSVRYLDHSKQADEVIAASISEFARKLDWGV